MWNALWGLHSGGLQCLGPPIWDLTVLSLDWRLHSGPTFWEPTVSRATDLGSGNALIGLGAYTLDSGGIDSGGLENLGPPI